MLSTGIWGLILCLLALCIYCYLFFYRQKKNEQLLQLQKLFITGMSVLLGISIYFTQQGVAEWIKTKELVTATKQEIGIVINILDADSKIDPNSCGSGAVRLYTDILPGEVIHMASTSPLIDVHRLGDLIYLNNFINDHNRWAEFAVDILRNKTAAEQIILQDKKLREIDEAILVQAKMILECWEKGTSQYDKDCS